MIPLCHELSHSSALLLTFSEIFEQDTVLEWIILEERF